MSLIRKRNPKSPHYEFGGPIGTFLLTIGCPLVTFALYLGCNEHGCPPAWSRVAKFNARVFFDLDAVVAYVQFLWALLVLYYILPGREVEGTALRDGSRLRYRMNAFATSIIFLGILVYGTMVHLEQTDAALVWLADHYPGLITASFMASLLTALYVYIHSFYTDELVAAGGNTGSFFHDFFVGRPLNPRIGEFDLKSFIELRPGLILWAILDIAFAARQKQVFGRITDSMVLVNAFQIFYVLDALFNEEAILTTMDITTDGFGFMLAFGNLMWVPMVYSLQARYLASHPLDLGALGILGVLAVQALGYYIFRGANGQKNAFRKDPSRPDVQHLESIKTAAGTRLLVSGWWGMARHINYLGDWIMAWAWCLPTGLRTPIPYFYVAYFAVLLVHRERRDEARCRDKYKGDWDKYTARVPSRIIPGVY